MKTHALAVRNAAEYDKRKGGKTMPPDVEAVWPEYKRRNMNDRKKDQEVGRERVMPYKPSENQRFETTNDMPTHPNKGRQVKIGSRLYGYDLCRQIWGSYRDKDTPISVLAHEYDISRADIHNIIQKGRYGKLGNKNVLAGSKKSSPDQNPQEQETAKKREERSG